MRVVCALRSNEMQCLGMPALTASEGTPPRGVRPEGGQ